MSLRLVLASSSPRRHDLLSLLGRPFDVLAPDINETVLAGELARDYVERLAVAKARAVVVDHDVLVIAADTTVDLDGAILGKPADAKEACVMLRALSGRTHLTHTGVCLKIGDAIAHDVVTTAVEFAALSDRYIEWYVATGEPMDKAGAYGLQYIGGCFVARIDGNAQNVIGLPMGCVLQLAAQLQVPLLV